MRAEICLYPLKESWQVYTPAIIKYAQVLKTKSKELKHALMEDDTDDEGLYLV